MKPLSVPKRILFGLGLPAMLLLLLLYERVDGVSLQCPFYRLTGLYCPGCGSGRAVRALLAGDLPLSFRQNPMLYLMGVPSALGVLREYLRIVFLPRRLRPIVLSPTLCVFLVGLILAWWVLRNIPALSFLAPIS